MKKVILCCPDPVMRDVISRYLSGLKSVEDVRCEKSVPTYTGFSEGDNTYVIIDLDCFSSSGEQYSFFSNPSFSEIRFLVLGSFMETRGLRGRPNIEVLEKPVRLEDISALIITGAGTGTNEIAEKD